MRAQLVPFLALLAFLAACGTTQQPWREHEARPYGLLQHPIIEDAADQLVSAAQSSITSGVAPDAAERWMIPPVVGESGVWEASALCFAIASREGKLRPVQPSVPLASIPAVQAWLRANQLAQAIWVVEVGGVLRPELKLVICTAERVWRSPVVAVSVPRAEKFSWPFSPEENPPLSQLAVGDAEALVELEGDVYLQSRQGLRRLQWYGKDKELRLERLRGWESFGRTWVTRNQGAPPDRTPALAILRRDLRLELRDADLPRGEGELVAWTLGRSGIGMELPLRRASAVEIRGLLATPYGWNLPDTWLVLRCPPRGEATVELFAAALRKVPVAPRRILPEPLGLVEVLSDCLRPAGLPAFDARMEDTHHLVVAGPRAPVLYEPRYDWLSPLLLEPLEPSWLPEYRTSSARDSVGVVRFSAVEEDYPLWRAASAKGRLAEGDWARWREHRAAPLWGVARIDPGAAVEERRALADWLRARTPLELFGEERAGLIPTLPVSDRRPDAPEPVDRLALSRPIWLEASDADGALLGLPPGWDGQRLERLALLLRDAGAEIAGIASATTPRAPEGSLVLQLTRLFVPAGGPAERALFLGSLLELESLWPEGWPRSAEDADPGFGPRFERWMLAEGHLIPLWREPGIVFVDRRLMGVRSDSTMLLPDLREARWLPESELDRLRARP